VNAEQVIQQAEKIAEQFSDGFQFEDIAVVVKEATKLAQIPGLPNQEKKDLAVSLISHVIDITDTPWLPDNWTDPILKKFVPGLIDLLVDASQGKLELLHE